MPRVVLRGPPRRGLLPYLTLYRYEKLFEAPVLVTQLSAPNPSTLIAAATVPELSGTRPSVISAATNETDAAGATPRVTRAVANETESSGASLGVTRSAANVTGAPSATPRVMTLPAASAAEVIDGVCAAKLVLRASTEEQLRRLDAIAAVAAASLGAANDAFLE